MDILNTASEAIQSGLNNQDVIKQLLVNMAITAVGGVAGTVTGLAIAKKLESDPEIDLQGSSQGPLSLVGGIAGTCGGIVVAAISSLASR